MHQFNVESLEGRNLMSAGLHHGTLSVVGGNGMDTIIVRADATSVTVEKNGESKSYARAKVRSIVVHGRAGNDLLAVEDADGLFDIPVVLVGGKGADSLEGGAANDVLVGGAGDDSMFGNGGNDIMRGDTGNDLMTGGAGNDVLRGGAGNDLMGGGEGDDLVLGGRGNDSLYGEGGADSLVGGAGLDTLDDVLEVI
jgi:Ca2+-binding RTX toxin-like protein